MRLIPRKQKRRCRRVVVRAVGPALVVFAAQPGSEVQFFNRRPGNLAEQGEVNWIWPYDQIEPTFHWTLERTIRDGGVSFNRTGETYPGFDICKLCSFLVFKKGKEGKEQTK